MCQMATNSVFFQKSKHLNMSAWDKELATISEDWIGSIHILQFMKMMHTFTKGWEMDEVQGLIKQLDTSYGISSDLFTVNMCT